MRVLLTCALLVQAVLAYNYQEALHKSILFYEAERSGYLPANNRVPWRGNSALGDRGYNGEDLVGGWYDAGDHVKFGFPMAWSTTTLAWGILEFKAGYEAAGEYQNALDCIRWPLDYFIKAHLNSWELWGQVGDGYADHAYWGRPEEMTMGRPSFSIGNWAPGSDIAGETCAAMAAGYLVFKDVDPGYAQILLGKARSLFDLCYDYRGKYTDNIPAQDFYGSTRYEDEIAWAALWMYRATNEQQYLDKANEFKGQMGGTAWAYSWDAKDVGVQMLYYTLTNDWGMRGAVENFIRDYMPGGSVQYTPRGLAWRDQWGPNRYAANAAFIALVAEKYGIMAGQGKDWARGQIHYMLGDAGRSYVVGFGNNPPQKPHHRAASCNWPPAVCNWNDHNKWDPNPHILYGALVGGPDQWDNYEDRRDDYIKNEVACDYNAGFQGALAGLLV